MKNRPSLHLLPSSTRRVHRHGLFLYTAGEIDFNSRAFVRHTVEDVISFWGIGEPPVPLFIMLLVNIQMDLDHIVSPLNDSPFQGNALDRLVEPRFTAQGLAFN
ncbi:hypothetical protein [Paenibacillus sp. CAA11]|uniref:hypothetical protein n=1 Tax=Paenibacillus sp. CAA11 TaxID=1532905 RepID=UPI00131EF577|nr:hypothetical protein [Paenibacillus sp. CAA11]